jgi:alcohol dehydrogenase class IV
MNFMFSIPSTVFFGSGAAKSAGEKARAMGAKKDFLVCDKGVRAAGLVDGVLAGLQEAPAEVLVFDEVEPNPLDTTIERAAGLAREFGPDIIVAVGGGSSMDAGKAVNILLTNPSPINQYAGLGMVKNPTKTLICVPTTAGTASEVTDFTIITDTKTVKKMVIGGPFVGPTIALVDPEMTVNLPPAITASTGLDALTHAIEAYVSTNAMIPTDCMALKAIELISANIVEATRNGGNLAAREAIDARQPDGRVRL